MAEGGPPSTQKDFVMCDKHPDKKVELYCEQHEEVCCLNCAWDEHHECRPKPCKLEEALVKIQNEQTNLVDKMEEVSGTFDKVIERLEEQIASMEEAESTMQKQFTSIKADIMSKLLELEQKFTQDLEDCISDKVKSLKESLESVKEKHEMLHQGVDKLLKANDPGVIAAFVKCKNLLKSCHVQPEETIKVPQFKLADNVHKFLHFCNAVGKITTDDDIDYENVAGSTTTLNVSESHFEEEDVTLMSDVIQEEKDTKPGPKQVFQHSHCMIFRTTFRLFSITLF